MIMYKNLLLLIFCFSIAACNEPTDTTTNTPAVEDSKTLKEKKKEAFDKLKEQNATTTADLEGLEKLPSINVEILEELWEKCTYVDYVYYQLPISASLDNQNSIRSAISHVSEERAAKRPDCKAIGRVFYQIDGENTLQGDIFFTKGCTYFLWVDKKGAYYAGNLITEAGLKFFASNINAALGKNPGQAQ